MALAEEPVEANLDQEKIRATLQSRFPDVKIDSIRPAPIDGLYEVVTSGQIAYVNKDASRLFSGNILDTATKEDLTTKRWNELHKIDFDSLPLEKSIKIVKGDGSRKLAVFADPLCPYCVKLEKELQSIDNVVIYTFLYPLENLHQGATTAARKIWCSKDRAASWQKWMLEHVEPEASSCADDVVLPLQVLGEKLKINSTPTLIFADGMRNPGFVTAAEIQAALKN